MRLTLAVLIAPALLASACVPIHTEATDWPGVDGNVLDVISGKPVAGATIAVRSGVGDFSTTTTTDRNGVFHLTRHAHQEWVHSDRYDAVFPAGTITVTAPGYAPFEHKLDQSMSFEAIPLAPTR
ncbi:MAG TPA: carboxypeptidase-like regulatory domain-containing protein [Alphaproteobacteria bacterium]|jgi:hypothetical protein|nr:carboxypeptidase-like regulatory domain-containing protein [Alphaproteobacteria bacterium]